MAEKNTAVIELAGHNQTIDLCVGQDFLPPGEFSAAGSEIMYRVMSMQEKPSDDIAGIVCFEILGGGGRAAHNCPIGAIYTMTDRINPNLRIPVETYEGVTFVVRNGMIAGIDTAWVTPLLLIEQRLLKEGSSLTFY